MTVDDNGTHIYVDIDNDGNDKLRRSGFLVTGRETTKADPDSYRGDLFAIDGALTTVYIDDDNSKLRRSGFW